MAYTAILVSCVSLSMTSLLLLPGCAQVADPEATTSAAADINKTSFTTADFGELYELGNAHPDFLAEVRASVGKMTPSAYFDTVLGTVSNASFALGDVEVSDVRSKLLDDRDAFLASASQYAHIGDMLGFAAFDPSHPPALKSITAAMNVGASTFAAKKVALELNSSRCITAAVVNAGLQSIGTASQAALGTYCAVAIIAHTAGPVVASVATATSEVAAAATPGLMGKLAGFGAHALNLAFGGAHCAVATLAVSGPSMLNEGLAQVCGPATASSPGGAAPMGGMGSPVSAQPTGAGVAGSAPIGAASTAPTAVTSTPTAATSTPTAATSTPTAATSTPSEP